jgi:hypothetical protein
MDLEKMSGAGVIEWQKDNLGNYTCHCYRRSPTKCRWDIAPCDAYDLTSVIDAAAATASGPRWGIDGRVAPIRINKAISGVERVDEPGNLASVADALRLGDVWTYRIRKGREGAVAI